MITALLTLSVIAVSFMAYNLRELYRLVRTQHRMLDSVE